MELLALLPLSQLSLCSTGQPWAAGGQLPAPGDPMQSCSITRKENLLCSPLIRKQKGVAMRSQSWDLSC